LNASLDSLPNNEARHAGYCGFSSKIGNQSFPLVAVRRAFIVLKMPWEQGELVRTQMIESTDHFAVDGYLGVLKCDVLGIATILLEVCIRINVYALSTVVAQPILQSVRIRALARIVARICIKHSNSTSYQATLRRF